jgi:hypothetical protein
MQVIYLGIFMPSENNTSFSNQTLVQQLAVLLKNTELSRTNYEVFSKTAEAENYLKECYYKIYASQYEEDCQYSKTERKKYFELEVKLGILEGRRRELSTDIFNLREYNSDRYFSKKPADMDALTKQKERQREFDSINAALKNQRDILNKLEVNKARVRRARVEEHMKFVHANAAGKYTQHLGFRAAAIILSLLTLALGGFTALTLFAPAVGAGIMSGLLAITGATIFGIGAMIGVPNPATALLVLLVAAGLITGGFFLYPVLLLVMPIIAITAAVLTGVCALVGLSCFIAEKKIESNIDNMDQSVVEEVFREGLDSLKPEEQKVNSKSAKQNVLPRSDQVNKEPDLSSSAGLGFFDGSKASVDADIEKPENNYSQP